MTITTPEFVARLARAQSAMAAAGLGALLLSTEADLRYFTGFLTRFWESPTRPWYLVVPAKGDPIAVIPSIGAALMGKTWIRDIRTWVSPDLNDDGVSLLIATPARGGWRYRHAVRVGKPCADAFGGACAGAGGCDDAQRSRDRCRVTGGEVGG